MPFQAPCPPGCKCGKHHRTRKDRKAIGAGRTREFLRRESEHQHAPVKTKVCTRCGKRKKAWPPGEADFHFRKTILKSGIGKMYPRPECIVCSRELVKERAKKRGPEENRKRRARYRKRRDADPDRREKHLAYQREWGAQARRKKGVPPGRPHKKNRFNGRGPMLPIGPFSTWLSQQCVQSSATEVARKCGLDEKQIRRWTSRKDEDGRVMKTVSIEAADKVFVALKQPDQMAVLYPPG